MMKREEYKAGKVLTETGKSFIRFICNSKNNSDLLTGNNGPLPYSIDINTGVEINKTWVAKPIIYKTENNNTVAEEINNNFDLGEALIIWFERAAALYNVDPNVLAAQAYVESKYRLWWYSKNTVKSGINQMKMSVIYDVVINNFSDETKMTINDISNIARNLENPYLSSSYKPKDRSDAGRISKINRGILHQNVMDFPYTMIKAQARYLKILSKRCNNLTSTTIFCYRKGIKYVNNTLSKSINLYKKDNNLNEDNSPDLNDGLDYIAEIFGVLGDKDNKLPLFNKYKPKGEYFGYNELFDNDDYLDIPNNNFDSYTANVDESNIYNISRNTLDNLSIVNDDRYNFIYFPSDQYIRTEHLKYQIVIHHTVSGGKDDVNNDILYWQRKGERVATSFIISRTGKIFQLFNTNYWAYHLGLKSEYLKEIQLNNPDFEISSNDLLNKKSIGIELDSWGGLIEFNGDYYPTIMDDDGDLQKFYPRENATPLNPSNVLLYNKQNGYDKGYRGFYAFEKYTDEQINSLRDLILSIHEKYENIDLNYNRDIFDIEYDENLNPIGSNDGAIGVSANALSGKSGIWSHSSYRNDKSDCHPQINLIKMLQQLI